MKCRCPTELPLYRCLLGYYQQPIYKLRCNQYITLYQFQVYNIRNICMHIYVYTYIYSEMITTVSLVNLHHQSQLQFFFLGMRTFKTYILSNFQINNTVLLTIVTIMYMTSPGRIYFITGRFYLVTTFTNFVHLPSPPRATTNLFSVPVSLFLFCFFQIPQHPVSKAVKRISPMELPDTYVRMSWRKIFIASI